EVLTRCDQNGRPDFTALLRLCKVRPTFHMKIIRGILAWAFLLAVALGAHWADRKFESIAVRWGGPAAMLAEYGNDRSPFRLMDVRQIELIFREHLRAYPTRQASDLARHLVEQCRRHSLKPALVLALIKAESSFRANAVSHRGAVG